MKKVFIAALLSVFIAAPAVAADAGGIYAGVKMGPSDVAGSTFGFGVYGGYNIDPNVTSRIEWGDFMSRVRFAGGGEYTSFGSNTSNTYGGVTYRASAIGAVLAATYPINSQFSVIVKTGLARTTYDVTCSGCGGLSRTTFGLRYGAAGQYNLTRDIGLRAGLDFYPDGYSILSAGGVVQF
jgi:OmpA-OmpF porin, OOP family